MEYTFGLKGDLQDASELQSGVVFLLLLLREEGKRGEKVWRTLVLSTYKPSLVWKRLNSTRLDSTLSAEWYLAHMTEDSP